MRAYVSYEIDVDIARTIVLVRQRWLYSWLTAPKPDGQGTPCVHISIPKATVLPAWNNRATLKVAGSSPVAKDTAHAIRLDTNDLTWRYFCKNKTTTCQRRGQHEFGHAFGNGPEEGYCDAYKDWSPYKDDHASITNVGNEPRVRHCVHLVSELTAMVPDTSVVVAGVK